jgi:hypothetical protein
MMQKLQASGVSRTTLGLVIPTGYSFNLDGVAITLPMSCLFIAQVYGIHLDLRQQITMFILMLFTSKGAAGVTGGAFAALAATVVASGLPAEGLALLLGIDRFMSQGRSIVNRLATQSRRLWSPSGMENLMPWPGRHTGRTLTPASPRRLQPVRVRKNRRERDAFEAQPTEEKKWRIYRPIIIITTVARALRC